MLVSCEVQRALSGRLGCCLRLCDADGHVDPVCVSCASEHTPQPQGSSVQFRVQLAFRVVLQYYDLRIHDTQSRCRMCRIILIRKGAVVGISRYLRLIFVYRMAPARARKTSNTRTPYSHKSDMDGIAPTSLIGASAHRSTSWLNNDANMHKQLKAHTQDSHTGSAWRRPSWRPPCLLYTSPSPRDRTRSRMPSSA